mgnify:CR=1 FL=1
MNVYAPLILKKRKEVGITQAEFAAALHYSVQTAAKYETGISEMDVVSLIVASRVLGIDVDNFIHGIDKKENDLADRCEFNADLFAKNIATARIARRVSQKNLAVAANCSTRSIKNYEAGNSVPSLTTFRLICDALDVKAHEFLFEDLSKRSDFYVAMKNKRIWVASGSIIGALLLSATAIFSGLACLL